MFPTSNPLPHTLSNTKTFEFLLIFFHLVLTSYHMTSIKIFSDDPNGIQLGVPIVTDNGFGHHTKKVLTPEMVNLGIKVGKYFHQFQVFICIQMLHFDPFDSLCEGYELRSARTPRNPSSGA